jgi:putative transposase
MQWPQPALQRCTNHKLWNLLGKAPAHLREELAEDYRHMIYALSREAVEQARVAFQRKWKAALQGGLRQLRGGRRRALHLHRIPCLAEEGAAYHQCAERINEEFRRRTKTQASLPSEEAVLFLLFGLLRRGQVQLHRLIGWQDLTSPQNGGGAGR